MIRKAFDFCTYLLGRHGNKGPACSGEELNVVSKNHSIVIDYKNYIESDNGACQVCEQLVGMI